MLPITDCKIVQYSRVYFRLFASCAAEVSTRIYVIKNASNAQEPLLKEVAKSSRTVSHGAVCEINYVLL